VGDFRPTSAYAHCQKRINGRAFRAILLPVLGEMRRANAREAEERQRDRFASTFWEMNDW
jgi:hypothetical protein